MKPKVPKRSAEISGKTKTGDVVIWVKKIIDEANIDMLYRYNTLDFGVNPAYLSLIKGKLHYKHHKEDHWYEWVEEYDLGSEEDDGEEIKQLIREYITKLVEQELLK